MITAASLKNQTARSLKNYTVKDLGQLAKKVGVSGWHSMRKEQLVRALARKAKSQGSAPSSKNSKSKSTAKSKSSPKATSRSKTTAKVRSPKTRSNKKSQPTRKAASTKSRTNRSTKPAKADTKKAGKKPSNPRVLRRIQQATAQREAEKDLTTAFKQSPQAAKPRRKPPVKPQANGSAEKDRIVLLVRDPFWLQACWELTRHSVQRAQAAMAEHWHTARPVLRLMEVETGNTTSTAERLVREIPIHGGVKNWYIDIKDPPRSYRVDIGYASSGDKFFSLARSNCVSTPAPGSSDAIDENWSDIAEDYEKIYALSGGYDDDQSTGELQEMFEERLRRPMGSPVMTRFGIGAERLLNRERELPFEVDAEMIIYGKTKPTAHVTLAGEPVKLRQDGTFTVRLSMPDRRQVLPVVASSNDGVQQRTIVLAVERNTKVMEPVTREGET